MALGAVALALPGGVAAEEPEEWERDAPSDLFYVSPIDAKGVPTHAVFRVVDDLTGEPLPGATAAFEEGSEHPVTGLVPAARTGIADAEGWVRIRGDDFGAEPTWVGAFWTYVEAAGHAGLAVENGRIDGEFRLGRAHDVVVEVRDAFDRPLAGATIGVRGSNTCGHNPDQRVAVSDREGRAVLHGLGLDGDDGETRTWEAWIVGEGIRSTYHEIAVPVYPSSPRMLPQILRHGPSAPIEGTVLDSEGRPVRGAHVGARGLHRGPWTVTDSSGAFRLVGAERFCEVTVESDDAERGTSEAGFTAPPPGPRWIVRLPPPGKDLPSPPTFDVEIRLLDAKTKEAIEGDLVPVVAVRDGDGWTVLNPAKPGIDLPSGSWTVFAGGGVSAWAQASARVDVKDERPPALTIEVTRNPGVRVACEDDPAKVSVWLVSASDERMVDPSEWKAGAVPVPVGGECVFRVQGGSRTWDAGPEATFVPIPLDRGGPDAKPIRLRALPPLVVHARLVTPDGKPTAGWLTPDLERTRGVRYEDWDPAEPARSEPTTQAYAEREVGVLVIPEDPALLPQVVTVRIPAGTVDGLQVDAGTVRLWPRGDRRLTVLGRDGKPHPNAEVRIIRDGIARHVPPSDDPIIDPRLLPLAAGDLVEVTARWDIWKHSARPVRKRLEGSGPWTIRDDLPATSIALEAADEAGKPIDATLVIDGKAYEGAPVVDDEGVRRPFEVEGVDVGPHRVAVSAANRVTRLYRVVLKEGEHRVLAPRLGPVPAAKPPK